MPKKPQPKPSKGHPHQNLGDYLHPPKAKPSTPSSESYAYDWRDQGKD